MGGWLNVRGLLRYKRISAGITEIESAWHFGQAIRNPQDANLHGPGKQVRGMIYFIR